MKNKSYSPINKYNSSIIARLMFKKKKTDKNRQFRTCLNAILFKHYILTFNLIIHSF